MKEAAAEISKSSFASLFKLCSTQPNSNMSLETFDDWADRIAREYADKRDRYNRQNSGAGSKRTATGGIGAGKRGKEGRRNRKERERLEYIDHKKRRVDNYIRAQVV